MLKEKKQRFATLGIWIVIIFTVSTIVNALWWISDGSVIGLSENQLLYFLSAEAQVIGTLFGLTLTAFIFFNEKFVVDADETDQLVFEAVRKLKKKYYQNLATISILVAVAIVLCFIGIASLNLKNKGMTTFIFVESILSGIFGLSAIVAFAISLLNPNKKEREIDRIIQNEKDEIKTQSKKLAAGVEDFIRPYNKMEKIFREWADYCISQKSFFESYRGVVHPNMTYNLRILNKFEIVDSDLQREIDQIRRFRNIMVHSEEPIDIPQELCDRLEKINTVLEDAFGDFRQQTEGNSEADVYNVASHERKYIKEHLM